MTTNPSACRICGLDERGHGQRWSKSVGWHQWTAPTDAQILRRMQDRRRARQTAAPTQYHATTGWAADHTGESADPYCADCKTDVCHRWERIQGRLNRKRWGTPPRIRRHRKRAADLPF